MKLRNFDEMNEKKRIADNFLWLLTEYASRLIGGIVISALVARQLGVEKYGVFQYAISLALIFTAFSFIFSAEILVPRLMHADAKERKRLMGNAFALRLIFSIFAYIALVLFASLTENRANSILIAIFGISILLTEGFSVVTAWLQSQANNRPKSILINIVTAVKIVLVYCLFKLGVRDSESYAALWVGESVLIAIGLSYIYFKYNREFFVNHSKAEILILLKEGLPFFAGLLAAYIFVRMDVFFMRHIGTQHELGLYTSALQLAQAMSAFSGILVMAMAPIMVYKHTEIKIIKRNVLVLCGVMLVFSISSAAIASYSAPWLIPLLFGEKYAEAIPILERLLWGSIFLFLDAALNVYLIKMRRGKWIAFKWIFVIVISALAYWRLISEYSAFGAVAGYTIGYGAATILGLCLLVCDKK